jgi:hypothetical protein
MMRDDFEDRLRTAMRRESDRLPFVVKMADIDRRLAEPSHRFSRWLALGAVALGTAFVVAILLATPRHAPLATSIPTPLATSGGATPPASCPITKRPVPAFAPPARFPATAPGSPGSFWYGGDELWTVVHDDGLWGGVPDASGGYGNKSFWWSAAYKVDEEPQPALLVLARRLDGPETAQSGEATNAAASDIGSAMLTGLTVPTSGCWELTGSYRGHELTYVVWIPGPDD